MIKLYVRFMYVRFRLALMLVNFIYRWLRWLDWHRKDRQGLKVWQDMWAWFMYQIVSGYPPGERDEMCSRMGYG